MKKNFFKDNPERVLGALALFLAGALILVAFAFGFFDFGKSKAESSKPEYSTSVILNVNTASEEELTRLEGISETLAKRIVQYREENGKFSCVDDLEKVNGIGQKKLDKLRKYIKAE